MLRTKYWVTVVLLTYACAECWAQTPELVVQTGHSAAVLSVAFSRDGKLLASCSFDATVKLWDMVSGRELRTLKGHSATVSSLAFSPDGKMLASGSFDKMIRLWDVASGRELRALRGHSSRVESVAFIQDGETLVSGSGDLTIKLWHVASGIELRTLTVRADAVSTMASGLVRGFQSKCKDAGQRKWGPDDQTVGCGQWPRITPAQRTFCLGLGSDVES